MEIEAPSNSNSLLQAIEVGNAELASRCLDRLGSLTRDNKAVQERMDELTDFLDILPRSTFAEVTRQRLHINGLSVLCELVHASEPHELRHRSPVLLSYLVSALGSPVKKLSESLWLMWLADRSTVEQALRDYGLTNANSVVKLASVKELEKWVEAMKGRIAFRKFTPNVVRLLRDDKDSVRQAAYTLLVRFFSMAKQPARDDLCEVMKRNQFNEAIILKLLMSITNASGENDQISQPINGKKSSEAVATIERPASSDERSPAKLSNNPRSPTESLDTNSLGTNSNRSQTGSIRTVLDQALELDCLADPLYPIQPVAAKDIYSADEFISTIMGFLSCFEGKESEDNWAKRQSAIHTYRKMLRSTEYKPPLSIIRDGFKLLQRGISDVLLSMRTTLVSEACQAVKDTAQTFSQASVFHELFDPLLESLTKVATGVKKITAALAHLTICAIYIEAPSISNRQFFFINQESKNLKPHARAYAFYWLKAAIIKSGIGSFVNRQQDVENIITKAVMDAAPSGRLQGRELFWATEVIWPELTQRILTKLAPSALKSLQATRPRSAPQVPGRRPSPVTAQVAFNVNSETHASQQRPRIPQTFSRNTSPEVIASPGKLTAPLARPKSPSNSPLRLKPVPLRLSTQNTPLRISSPVIGSPNHSRDDPLSQSIADLSMRDFHASDEENISIRPVEDLRTLAQNESSEEALKDAVESLRAANPTLRDPFTLARIIQTDVENVNLKQREVYLRILRLLDYGNEPSSNVSGLDTPRMKGNTSRIEEDSPEVNNANTSVENIKHAIPEATKILTEVAEPSSLPKPPNYRRTTNSSPVRKSIYIDSESGSEDESFVSQTSLASSVSTRSHSMNGPKVHENVVVPEQIGIFPTSPKECKTKISEMVEQVKRGSCDVDELAALTVLVTASSATSGSSSSPLHVAVSIWRQFFTYDMTLRDKILPFLSQDPSKVRIEQVIIGLALLRSLLLCRPPHAAVYLDPLSSMQTLCKLSTNFGNISLELDEHLLPDVSNIILSRHAEAISTSALLDMFSSVVCNNNSNHSSAKIFCLKAAVKTINLTNSSLDTNERHNLIKMVTSGIYSNNVQVRKEVYPLLLTVHRHDSSLANEAAKKLSPGQRELFNYYLEAAI